MYIVSAVFSVVALSLGIGGISWAPLVFLGACFLSLFVSLWRVGHFEARKQYHLGDHSALAGSGFYMGPIILIACCIASLVALLVALGESDFSGRTVLSLVAFVVAFAGGQILALRFSTASGESSGESSDESSDES